MGDSINSANWDAYFTVDATGEYGFLSTTKNSTGGTDLAKAKISESKRPKSYINLFGKIYDADNKSALNAKITYQIIDGNTSEEKIISSADSNYKTTLNYGKKYIVGFSLDKFYPLSDTFDLTKIDTYKEVQRDIYLNRVIEKPVSIDSDSSFTDNLDSLNEMLANLKVGQVLTSNRVLFDFAKSILRSDSYKSLDKMVKLMQLNTNMTIELSAHTDFIGSDKANQKLSEDRAVAARQYLISKGIDESRIVPKGYGSSVPVASNDTEEGRQQNRRVEFKILKK
jgi:outer membrane protein OmpA-like peptidoglycan-associated protein